MTFHRKKNPKRKNDVFEKIGVVFTITAGAFLLAILTTTQITGSSVYQGPISQGTRLLQAGIFFVVILAFVYYLFYRIFNHYEHHHRAKGLYKY
ncbi:hypothetical protein J4430_01425 [Candidatus Woesearchaeota archaeon]|nr:hypothetical protein [Candidatus Woesearchaeota archaeon]